MRRITDNNLWLWLNIIIKLASEVHLTDDIMIQYENICSLPTFDHDSISYCEDICLMNVHPLIKYYAEQYLLEKHLYKLETKYDIKDS